MAEVVGLRGHTPRHQPEFSVPLNDDSIVLQGKIKV